MAAGAGMMTKKQQAEWDALPQEEKDRIDAEVAAGIQRKQQQEQEDKAVELRKAYELDPELWRSKNLSGIAALMLVKAGTTDPVTLEVFMANYQGKIRELSRATDTALERSLVEYAAVCWVRLQWIDMAYSQKSSSSAPIENLDYWDRHLAAAQQRFDKACIDLAKVRRLALPVLQLNIAGKQQVNNVGQVNNSKG
jgi:hypothetical protein